MEAAACTWQRCLRLFSSYMRVAGRSCAQVRLRPKPAGTPRRHGIARAKRDARLRTEEEAALFIPDRIICCYTARCRPSSVHWKVRASGLEAGTERARAPAGRRRTLAQSRYDPKIQSSLTC